VSETIMNSTRIPTLFLVCSLATVAACVGGGDADGLRAAPDAVVPAEAEPAAEAPRGAQEAPAVVAAAPAPAVREWRPWMEAEVERLRRDRPDYFDQVMALPARSTRASFLRITGPLVRDPDAAPILLHRLLSKGEAADVRAAIVETLPRTGGDFSAALAELMVLETDPRVRELVCASLSRAQAPYALLGLARGVADSAAAVRAEALRSLGRRPDGVEQAPAIIAALTDPDEMVQQEAARALGNLKVEAAKDALVGRLSSPSADVRRHSLRALSRIDEPLARSLPQLEALRTDPDPKLARLAEHLAK
jgi:HEAT repeat protein